MRTLTARSSSWRLANSVTVRQVVGKGASPRELTTAGDVIGFVNTTPGAMGYVGEGGVAPGMNVLLTWP